ncbi:superfamily II DNA or RNA helicase [Acetoanaerobium pronyense]|uniref:Superfamily II DNA or RNA helicase n=1 Tax=Acetoanaerobium pronyense TaxID=1482736 RepID=A0ABS4KGG4_9FIRM|nr:superfamily II DNA or RNA helicase [Acetoanaerobium pronyense]
MSEIKLYEHQEKALEAIKDKSRAAIYLDMG